MVKRTSNDVDTGEDDLGVAPFVFDSRQVEAGAGSTSLPGQGSNLPGGQFSDAEMEFEPFMFDTGGMNTSPSGLTFEPFPVPESADGGSGAHSSGPISTDAFTLVGGDLPMPSYLSSTPLNSAPLNSRPLNSSPLNSSPLNSTPLTSSPLTSTGPASQVPDVVDMGRDTTTGLSMATEPYLNMPTNTHLELDEQMTGRTPISPITPLSPSTHTTTGLGRTRGNTGPLGSLGPLPPDRSSVAHASWSDSSLASIEDFSSILIAMQAGKRLRQSGPLSESMLPQSASSGTAVAVPQADAELPTDQMVSPFEASNLAATDTMPELQTSGHIQPLDVPTYSEPQLDAQEMPEWAMRAAQSDMAHVSAVTDMPEMLDASHVTEPVGPSDRGATMTEQPAVEAARDSSWATGQLNSPADHPSVVTDAYGMALPHAQTEIHAGQPEQQPPHVSSPLADNTVSGAVVAGEPESEQAAPAQDAHRVVASGAITVDDLEFEGFMFNSGTSTPLANLDTQGADDLAALHNEMGPAFDPTPYVVPEEDESEGLDSNYADLDHSVVADLASSPAGTTSGLPFWLQDTTTPRVAPVSGVFAADSTGYDMGAYDYYAGAVQTPQSSNDPAHVIQPSAANVEMAADEDDFGQLPPIAPFDFSLLPTNDVEESLGFNTEELSGLMSNTHDPMTVTVNLAAVADLIGGPIEEYDGASPVQAGDMEAEDPTGQISYDDLLAQSDQPVHHEWQDSTDMAAEANEADTMMGLDMLSVDDEAAEDQPVDQPASHSVPVEASPISPVGDIYTSGGWMASATTNLTDGNLGDIDGGLVGRSHATEVDLGVEGMVAPFNIDQLGLEDDEQHTGQLDVSMEPRSYGTGKLDTSPTDDSLPPMPLGDFWREADGDASLFMTSNDQGSAPVTPAADYAPQGWSPITAEAEEGDPTGYLADDDPRSTQANLAEQDYESAPAPEQGNTWNSSSDGSNEYLEEPVKVRVARGPWMSFGPEQGAASSQPDPTYTPTAPATPEPSYTPTYNAPSQPQSYHMAPSTPQPDAASEPQFEATPVPPRNDALNSGPLPPLTGFEDMDAWLAENPDNIGGQLALAAAYSQAGNADAALRVYRKIIRKPHASETILRMIGDDLVDLESIVTQLPRYYQVLGDLYMRIGKAKEAVEAYNKIP